MITHETSIEGLFVIELKPFCDERGKLLKIYQKKAFCGLAGINKKMEIKEVWFTESHINVIRAMHLQVGKMACEKIVSIIKGKVHDVVLDIRKNSPTYGKYFDLEISENDPKSLYIPIGCAHGYKVLQDPSIVMYMGTKSHSPKDDIGIRYDSFGYDWKISKPIISQKDMNLPLFGEYQYEEDVK